MPKLQPAERAELVYVAALTAAAFAAVAVTGRYSPVPAWYELAGFTLAAFLLGTRTLRVSETIGTVSVGFMFVFAAILELGPLGGLLAAAASALGGTLLSAGRAWRMRPIVVLAGVANLTLAAAASGWTYLRLHEACAEIGLTGGLLPAFVVIGVYYAINSFGVALMASPDEGRSAVSLWCDNLSWTVLPFYFGGGVVMVMHLVALAAGSVVWLALIPTVLVVHVALELRTKARFAGQVAAERARAQ